MTHYFGLIAPADTRFVSFNDDKYTPPIKQLEAVPLTFPDLTEWSDVPPDQWVSFLKERTDFAVRVPNKDYARELTEKCAADFYGLPLYEAVVFDIQKRPSCEQLIIEDVDVIVERFVSWAPVPVTLAITSNIDIICVEISKCPEKPLPWHFGAKYLLDDSVNKTVRGWRQQQFNITDGLQRRMKIKVQAKDRGIYFYRVDLLLRTNESSHIFRVPLLADQRVCKFAGGRKDDPVGDSAREAQKAVSDR